MPRRLIVIDRDHIRDLIALLTLVVDADAVDDGRRGLGRFPVADALRAEAENLREILRDAISDAPPPVMP